jgi:succinate-semialdehyde dehydrogenase / glutarate-semialdehyde dehydrogenase
MSLSFSTYNPYTNEKIKDWCYADLKTAQSSIKKLHDSFLNWKILSPSDRQKKLLRVVEQFEIYKEQIAISITEQMGKPITQAKAEVQKTIEGAKVLCEMDLEFLNPKTINSIYSASRIINEPLGVIIGIMPWNFPFWQMMRMVFPSLITGNTVLLKHSEVTPEIGEWVQLCFQKADFGFEVLKHELFSHDLTETLLSDELVGGVSLTGSTRAGQIVSEVAGRYLKKSIFELGGSDPYVVLTDANLKFAAKKIVQSRMNNGGQVCISAKRAFIHESQLPEFLGYLKSEIQKFEFADPRLESTNLGPLAHLRFQTQYNEQILEVEKYGQKIEVLKKPNSAGAFVQPVIFVFEKNHDILKTLEIFGPALIVIAYKNEDEAVQMANSTVYGLGAAVFSVDVLRAQKIAEKIIAGQIAINDTVKSDVHLPFGGFKSSGFGRELGHSGFFEFTQSKVISVK